MEQRKAVAGAPQHLESYFVLDREHLSRLAGTHREAYGGGQPFPHIVIDDFLPEIAIQAILDEFPAPGAISWEGFESEAEKKLAARAEEQMGYATRLLLYQLNSSVFLEFLEALTGIDGLIPDPYLGGGGLHQIERGGYLKVHADFNWHPKLRLDRRLNLLLYLNRGWKEAYGGHLELWNEDMTRAEQKILPVFNRCVIFSTTDTSFHGHPDPLRCPPGQTRKSLALYYYSNGRPEAEQSAPHSTLFRARPGEPELAAAPSGRPGAAGREDARHRPGGLRGVVRKLLPPILFDAWRALRRGRRSPRHQGD